MKCQLYLAPSTIPNAGYGVFAGVDFQEGDSIGEADLVIPVIDEYKNLPYRSQQHFASWLAYVWPSEPDAFYQATRASFPTIPSSMYKVDTGLNGATSLKFRNDNRERINAFAPGLASLVNSSPEHVNIQSVKRQHSVSFVARHDIKAGTELFLHYGNVWHARFMENETSETEFDSLEDYNANILPSLTLPSEEEKRNKLFRKSRKSLDVDDDLEDQALLRILIRVETWKWSRDSRVKSKRFFIMTNTMMMNDEYEYEEYEEEYEDEEEYDDEEEEEEEPVPMKSVDWLQQHGMCISNLSIGVRRQGCR